jgi:hypothetical protein
MNWLQVLFTLAWIAGLTFLGGFIGVQIARHGQVPSDSFVVITQQLERRTIFFFSGAGIGLVLAVASSLVYFLIAPRPGRANRPSQASDSSGADKAD